MQRLLILCVAVWFAMFPGTARSESPPFPSPQTIEGTVIRSESVWNSRSDRIITKSLIRTANGQTVEVSQAGGTVDGIGMRQYPSPPLVAPGDQVAMEVRRIAADMPWQVNQITSLIPSGPVARFQRGTQQTSSQMGYVRTTTAANVPLYWASSCVFLSYDSAGTTHLPDEQEFTAVDQVFASWRQSIESCSYLRFQLEGRVDDVEVGFDGLNLLKFRDDSWCRPDTEDNAGECYDPRAAGLTTLFFVNDPESARNGEILDADIEINGVNFAISLDGVTQGAGTCMADLLNTLTHEVGHLLGLDHTCQIGSEAARMDHQGNPVPLCSDPLPPEITEATMYPSQTCGETKKATLESDDIGAICAIYPAEDAPNTCTPVSLSKRRSVCSVGPTESPRDLASLLWPLAGVGLFLLSRRRKTRPRREYPGVDPCTDAQ